jgi:hypothetical protein
VYPEFVDVEYFINGAIGHSASFFLNARLFKTTGLYDEDLTIASDWKFFLMARVTPNIVFKKININLTVFMMDGLSTKNEEIGKK